MTNSITETNNVLASLFSKGAKVVNFRYADDEDDYLLVAVDEKFVDRIGEMHGSYMKIKEEREDYSTSIDEFIDFANEVFGTDGVIMQAISPAKSFRYYYSSIKEL